MLSKLSVWYRLCHVVMSIALISCFSCGPKERFEGVYQARDQELKKYGESQLELMEKGRAIWKIPDDEVSFRWQIKANEIWLSTKAGGIIIGKIHDDTIEIKLPGAPAMSFKKVKE